MWQNSFRLNKFRNDQNVKVIILNNVGFAKANNLGFKKKKRSSKYLLLLNPDTFLDVDFVRKAISIMCKRAVGEILVFFSQDAIPKKRNTIETLIVSLIMDETITTSYGR